MICRLACILLQPSPRATRGKETGTIPGVDAWVTSYCGIIISVPFLGLFQIIMPGTTYFFFFFLGVWALLYFPNGSNAVEYAVRLVCRMLYYFCIVYVHSIIQQHQFAQYSSCTISHSVSFLFQEDKKEIGSISASTLN